jgi:hypothetical protein
LIPDGLFYHDLDGHVKFTIAIVTIFFSSFSCADAQIQKSTGSVETTGIFDGKLVWVGNFHRERVYKINEYCISGEDLPREQVDFLKGKRVLVRGILKVVKGKLGPVKSSRDGRIYEPFKEPDKKYIKAPRFTILD